MEDTRRDFPQRYRPRKRRSLAAGIALALLAAAMLVGIVAATYVVARSGALDAIIARVKTELQPPAGLQLAQQQSLVAAPEVVRPPMPNVQGLVILIRNAVVALHQANTTGNYSVLREIASPAFQQVNSPASLSGAFADLRSRGMDLSQIVVVDPRLHSDPVLNEQGLLQLLGFFPVGPEQVDFELVYQMVDGRWRLFGIGVHPPKSRDPADGGKVVPKPPAAAKPALPDPASMVALIRSAVIALNQANMAGDYSVLHDLSAPGFQQTNSPAQLSAIFAELRARQLDLGPATVISPRLFRPPAIDQQGFLRLTGFFPSRPEQVNFDLAFQFVAGDWRLFGIGLNTSREVPGAAATSVDPATDDGGSSAPPAATPDAEQPPAPRPRPAG